MIERKTVSSKVFDVFNIGFLTLLSIISILPIWYTLALSLSSKSAAAAGKVVLWPVEFTTISYSQIINDIRFFNAFGVSIKRVALSVIITFTVTILMAYPLSKTTKDFKGRNVIMWLLVFVMMFNGGLIPWYLTIKSLGLLNSIWALVLGGGLPVFNVILVINFFRNLPKGLEEAAIVDGAGPWTTLFKIFVPLSKPVMATITLFIVVYHWNEFFNGLVLMTKQDKYPLQTYIQQLVVILDTSSLSVDEYKKLNELSNQTLNAAKIFIAMIPVLVLYPFLQRYFIKGITLGSIKE